MEKQKITTKKQIQYATLQYWRYIYLMTELEKIKNKINTMNIKTTIKHHQCYPVRTARRGWTNTAFLNDILDVSTMINAENKNSYSKNGL